MKLVRIKKELKLGRVYNDPEELDLWILERYPGRYYETSRSFYGDLSETICLDSTNDGILDTFFEPITRDNKWIVGYAMMSESEWVNLTTKLTVDNTNIEDMEVAL